MEIKELANKLRMILFRNCDCSTLTIEFERVLELCGCKYEVSVIEDDNAIIIEVPNCIQFTRKKGNSYKIYESIADSSSLK